MSVSDSYPYLAEIVRRLTMDATARLTSKGQVTIPKAVRDALGLNRGDQLVFRVEQRRAIVAKTPDFVELAGAVHVPPERRGVAWEEIRRQAHRAAGERKRKGSG
jgi:antitoxin PrlF